MAHAFIPSVGRISTPLRIPSFNCHTQSDVLISTFGAVRLLRTVHTSPTWPINNNNSFTAHPTV
nr:hypothetical protein JG3_0050 [uncultured bacterium]